MGIKIISIPLWQVALLKANDVVKLYEVKAGETISSVGVVDDCLNITIEDPSFETRLTMEINVRKNSS